VSIRPTCPPASFRRLRSGGTLALIGLGLAGFAGVGRAAWAPDGTRLTVAPLAQISAALAPDGAGGAFAAWVDSRAGNGSDIYAQRINGAGTIPAGWQADGNGLTAQTCYKYAVAIVGDGAGGAILAWSDDRCLTHHDLMAQRVTASGAAAPGWPDGGVVFCAASGNQDSPVLVSDGAGGAFVAWEDWRSGSSMVYALRLLAGGTIAPGWPADGLAVCPAGAGESLPALAGDDAGGVFVAWQDRRTGVGDIDLERFDGSGARVAGWPADGLLVGAEPGNQGSPAVTADGAGGVVVAWLDHRGSSDDIYGGDAALASGWPADGTPVCTASGDQRKPVICGDGAGGVVVAWQDRRAGTWDVYAQRLAGNGTPAAGWSADGVPLCAASGDQLAVQIAADAAGGAYVAWQDARTGSSHVYAQHVGAAGSLAAGWNADGEAVCTAAGSQVSPRIVADGAGGAIVGWVDSRSANATLAPSATNRRTVASPMPDAPPVTAAIFPLSRAMAPP